MGLGGCIILIAVGATGATEPDHHRTGSPPHRTITGPARSGTGRSGTRSGPSSTRTAAETSAKGRA
jgi:hypothetical protein